jgi:hypothetical protein
MYCIVSNTQRKEKYTHTVQYRIERKIHSHCTAQNRKTNTLTLYSTASKDKYTHTVQHSIERQILAEVSHPPAGTHRRLRHIVYYAFHP